MGLPVVTGVSLLPWVLQGTLGSFRKELAAGQVVSSVTAGVRGSWGTSLVVALGDSCSSGQ